MSIGAVVVFSLLIATDAATLASPVHPVLPMRLQWSQGALIQVTVDLACDGAVTEPRRSGRGQSSE